MLIETKQGIIDTKRLSHWLFSWGPGSFELLILFRDGARMDFDGNSAAEIAGVLQTDEIEIRSIIKSEKGGKHHVSCRYD